MTVQWTHAAVQDLAAAADHLAERNPIAADALVDRVLVAVATLADGRFDGPETTLATGETVRRWVIRPYTVFYRRDGDPPQALVVLRVFHGRREPIEP